MAKLSIEGQYLKEGKQFKKGSLVLHIGHRKSPTVAKPKLFLRAIKPQFEYISSLYPTKENEYVIDYSGAKYIVLFTTSTAEIKKVC